MTRLSLDGLFSFDALWHAARRAARSKRRRPSVARVMIELEALLFPLRDDLLEGRWRPSPARPKRVYDPKPRMISVPTFLDRVVHQALCAGIGPRHERRLIAHTYACRLGSGTHAALRMATAWARTYPWWVRLDVARFFPSIDHGLLHAMLAADLPERPVLSVCEAILDAAGTVGGHHALGDDLFAPLGRRVGLPLGNLTSQLWANRYLDPVDHLVKDRLRHRPYLRYMDDLLLFGDSHAGLSDLARAVEEACHALRLRLHPWSVQPTRAGVGFVGYRVMPDHVRVRRTSAGRAERRLRATLREAGGDLAAIDEGMRSVFAHWRHADSWRLRERTLRRLGLLYEPAEFGPLPNDGRELP